MAFTATFSYTGLPVRRLNVANSSRYVPTAAVQVIGVSVGFTPLRRFTVPYGIPVGVSKAEDEIIDNFIEILGLLTKMRIINVRRDTIGCFADMLSSKSNKQA